MDLSWFGQMSVGPDTCINDQVPGLLSKRSDIGVRILVQVSGNWSRYVDIGLDDWILAQLSRY